MAVAADTSTESSSDAPFRYGVVFLILLTLLVFDVIAPDASWAWAISLALAGAALTLAVATSRTRDREFQRARALVVGALAVIVVALVAADVISEGATFLLSTLVLALIPIMLGGGLWRLIGQKGVTIQAVAGALAIYLVIGLLFGSLIGFVARVDNGQYFEQATNVSNGVRVYYSFTVLTTTGFGDYTSRTPVGHALAVLEMLMGQLYLVTVIGVLVGNFAGRRARSSSNSADNS
jgi:Ion channel